MLAAVVPLSAATVPTSPQAAQPAPQTGSITGNVTGAGAGTGAPVVLEGATITAAQTGASYSATTDANGNYTIASVPPGTYVMTFSDSPGYQSQTIPGVQVSAGQPTEEDVELEAAPGAIAGIVTGPGGTPLYGMVVEAVQQGVSCPAGYVCGVEAVTGPSGAYRFTDVLAGGYTVEVDDAGNYVTEGNVTVTGGSTETVNAALGPPPVPAGTTARNAAKDLGYLNALRASVGLPAGIVLNTRWSTECAAHDNFEADNHVLQHPENLSQKGASVGGNWAGTSSILASYEWTRTLNPWWNAPIHLIQMLSPSLSVVGIDNSGSYQCQTTWPGMLRTPVAHDTIFTYPGNGAKGVPPSEDAMESPFVPGQFVGIPYGRTAGRELFVYLNLAGQAGQAQVKILGAKLTAHGRPVAIRWVDNTTRELGEYLSGGILLPVKPMHGRTKYNATVTVKDGSGSLSHSWSFTTSRG
jgi:carboxypeptidase family protein